MKRSNRRGNPVILIAILILVPVFILSGLQFLESTGLFDKHQDAPIDSKTIVRDGVSYYPRQDITVILLSGIDTTGPMVDSGSYNNDGQADMVTLLIFDRTNKKLDVLALNRDTMLDIPVLGVTGKEAGTVNAQLALAHTYGTGLKDSSQNLSKAVSNFLYGVQIDYYITMNMDAIGILNDAVGGVEVEITEDFSAIDPTMTGKVKLNAQQAQIYLQTRRGLGDQLNTSRMQRQEKYMRAFLTALQSKTELDADFLTNLYDSVSPYMVTDCSVKVLSTLSKRFEGFTLGQIITLKGENKAGQYMEFHVDEDHKDEVILKYLYAPKK